MGNNEVESCATLGLREMSGACCCGVGPFLVEPESELTLQPLFAEQITSPFHYQNALPTWPPPCLLVISAPPPRVASGATALSQVLPQSAG